jgi:hypothetical protein
MDAEADVLRDIVRDRDSAMHFSVVSTMGHGEFGYVFKVRTAGAMVGRNTDVCEAGRVDACGCVDDLMRESQVRCTHPRHPFPHKHYALKMAINYANVSRSTSIARRYGFDCVVLRRLRRHANLCSLLAEFTSAVPDDMFERMTPVRPSRARCRRR